MIILALYALFTVGGSFFHAIMAFIYAGGIAATVSEQRKPFVWLVLIGNIIMLAGILFLCFLTITGNTAQKEIEGIMILLVFNVLIFFTMPTKFILYKKLDISQRK